jgi:hypothetical protein
MKGRHETKIIDIPGLGALAHSRIDGVRRFVSGS